MRTHHDHCDNSWSTLKFIPFPHRAHRLTRLGHGASNITHTPTKYPGYPTEVSTLANYIQDIAIAFGRTQDPEPRRLPQPTFSFPRSSTRLAHTRPHGLPLSFRYFPLLLLSPSTKGRSTISDATAVQHDKAPSTRTYTHSSVVE